MARKDRRQEAPQPLAEAVSIDSLDLEGQGVARMSDGKVLFVEGALPGETARVVLGRSKASWAQATAVEILQESAQRVRPGCPHFGLHPGACGGCKMQHLGLAAQVAAKQRVLEDNLWHLGKVRPEQVLRPLVGEAWGYRQRARLSVRYVPRKETVLVGFHERKSRYVADMLQCPVLPARVSALLPALRALVESMEQRDQIPQLELACGDTQTALVLRHLQPLSEADRARLRAFGAAHGIQWWLQAGGPQTVTPLDPADATLAYRLPEFDVTLDFLPTDFTQVNGALNRVMVAQALAQLDAQPGERLIDWFCGLGNFTLPMARKPQTEVLGVEGAEALVARARQNAARNGLGARTRFEARNLFEISAAELQAYGPADRWLIDPPREGAFALVKALTEAIQATAGPAAAAGTADAAAGGTAWQPPRRIVYVSCNPATLARDAGLLVHLGGYRCRAAGVINLFAHTAHVESMAVFDRD